MVFVIAEVLRARRFQIVVVVLVVAVVVAVIVVVVAMQILLKIFMVTVTSRER